MIKKIQNYVVFISILGIIGILSIAHIRSTFAEDGGLSPTTISPNTLPPATVVEPQITTNTTQTPGTTNVSNTTSGGAGTSNSGSSQGGAVSPATFVANPTTPVVVPVSTTTRTALESSVIASSSNSVNEIAHFVLQIQQDTENAKTAIATEINKTSATTTTHAPTINASSTHTTVSARATSIEDLLVQTKKETLIKEVNSALTVKNVSTQPQVIKELHKKVDTTLTEIGDVKKVNTTEQKQLINAVITTQETQIAQDKQTLSSRKGLDLYLDDDHDGVSNFDEVNIFHTDPEKYSTTGGLSDGEKILRGIDPLATSTIVVASATSTTNSATTTLSEAPKIQYESPTLSTNVLPQTLVVTNVEVSEKTKVGAVDIAKKIAFTGKALPNSYVTLYIYSTPIIVTVKTDNDGNWTYNLDKELENGHHSMYVAMVNNSGKVIARSNAIPFIKQAAAAELDPGTAPAQASQGFFKTYFIEISIAVLVLALVSVLAISGMMRAKDTTLPPQNE